jgi:hypothetical protein
LFCGFCPICKHVWIVAHLPMPMSKFANVLKRATCPKCGNEDVRVAPSPPDDTRPRSAMTTPDLSKEALDELEALVGRCPNHNRHTVSHHGPPVLTRRDVAICQAMSRWIDIAREKYGPDWLPAGADIEKSRLFWRLRSGKEPLDHPPPCAFSCPWYEVIEEPHRPHWAFEAWEMEGAFYIAQNPYEVLERNAQGVPSRVGFGPWSFRCWEGPLETNPEVKGWWIQIEITPPAAPSATSSEKACIDK